MMSSRNKVLNRQKHYLVVKELRKWKGNYSSGVEGDNGGLSGGEIEEQVRNSIDESSMSMHIASEETHIALKNLSGTWGNHGKK